MLRRSPPEAKPYEQEQRKLNVELVKMKEWVYHEGLRVCILFESRDGAGKGGTIAGQRGSDTTIGSFILRSGAPFKSTNEDSQ